MKKIYLFSMMVLGFVATSVGQAVVCPTMSGPATKLTLSFLTPPRCVVTYNTNDVIDNNWYISLIDFDGARIPLYGTGPGTANPVPIQYLHIDPGTGSASFYYDCATNPNFIEPEFIEIAHFQENDTVTICTKQIEQGAVTPVKLTSFTGRLQSDNSVVLDWTSAIELDSYKYEVERSDDGLHFTKVGELEAAGNSATTIKYTFNDQLSSAGAYFYRLKQIDFNGTFEHSKVVYVNSKKGAGAVTKVFPNPTKGEIQLIGATSADLQPNNLSIFSISGQRIKYQVIGNAISMDPAAPDGVYIIRLQSAAGLQQFKVVKNQSAKTY